MSKDPEAIEEVLENFYNENYWAAKDAGGIAPLRTEYQKNKSTALQSIQKILEKSFSYQIIKSNQEIRQALTKALYGEKSE